MKESKNVDLHPDEDGDFFKAEKAAFLITVGLAIKGMDEADRRAWIAQETQAVDETLRHARNSYSETSAEVTRLRAQRRVLYELATGL